MNRTADSSGSRRAGRRFAAAIAALLLVPGLCDDSGLWHVADNADLSLGSGYAAGGDANPNASPDGAG